MNKHYFTEKGAKAEKVILELSQNTFFTDWCYPNQFRPDGKELCDLLVVFDDTVIIWQIKDLKTDEDGRYKQAEVDKNIRQLSGARRTLFDLKVPQHLTNPRRGKELFDPSTVKKVHLISVMMGDAEGPVPFMDTIKTYKVHMFTREFADIALRELDTVSDFCRYLEGKEDIDVKFLTIMGGEENLLGKYLHAGRSFDWMKDYDTIYIDDTIWPSIQAKPDFIAKKDLDQISYGWDSMIDRAHEGSAHYERVARELARPDRFTRRTLSKSFMEAYTEVVTSNLVLLRRKMALGDTTYCFLITNDDEYPSKRRRDMLGLMCFVARGIELHNKRVVGVATNRLNKSYDFAYLYTETWTPENDLQKQKIQLDLGIFSTPRITRDREDEYPTVE